MDRDLKAIGMRVSLLVLSVVLTNACNGNGSGEGDDSDSASSSTDLDSDTDSDSDSDTGTGSETESSLPCEGECAQSLYTTCTCGIDDPCGWVEDGYCDGYCIEGEVIGEMFDDSGDCEGLCSGLCSETDWTIYYVPCTCDKEDPCGWAENGVCDDACLEVFDSDGGLDDTLDCDGGLDGGGM